MGVRVRVLLMRDVVVDDTAAKATTEQAAELLPIRGVKQ